LTGFDSRRVYEVWTRLVQDEALYEAMLAGTHAAHGLDAEAVAILDAFRAEPGTRWNVENLRFRSALETGDSLMSYMPRTMKMLTRGDDDWRQELCFEYLAHHQWKPCGHLRLAECVRFGEYVRTRILKRRVVPRYFADVLAFELAIVELLRATASVPAGAWPIDRERSPEELAAMRPRRSPAQTVIELAVDLRPWIESADPAKGDVKEKPITLLAHVPSLAETHKIKTISAGVRIVIESCDGTRTIDEIAKAIEDEHGLPAPDVRRLIGNLVGERILCA
jgi:hypothetical protein